MRGRGGRGAVAWDARPAARARRPGSDVAVGAAAGGEHGQAAGAQRSGARGQRARAAADDARDRAAPGSCSEPVGQPASWSCAAARRRGPEGAPARTARSSATSSAWPLVELLLLVGAAVAAVLLGALAVSRLWARRRRVYALYELHLSLQDEAPFGRVVAMVRQIGGTLRARPAGAAGWRAAVRRVGADRDAAGRRRCGGGSGCGASRDRCRRSRRTSAAATPTCASAASTTSRRHRLEGRMQVPRHLLRLR